MNNQECKCGVSVPHTHGEGGLKDVRITEDDKGCHCGVEKVPSFNHASPCPLFVDDKD